MATLEGLTAPEQKDIASRLHDVYERCEHNMLQLCKKFEAMESSDFDPLNMPIQDIAEIKKIFPQGKSWSLDGELLKYEETGKLTNNDYTEQEGIPLGIGNKNDYVKFAGNKVKVKKRF